MNHTDVWKAVLGELEVILSKANFTTWFKDTSLLAYENKKALVAVPSEFYATWFKKHYHQHIFKSLKKHYPELAKLDYQVVGQKLSQQLKSCSTAIKAINRSKPSYQARRFNQPINANLKPEYNFESFITGASNRLAFASAQAVAATPGKLHNPFFIYGGVGLGKTHLLHAIGNAILQKKPRTKILYVSCEDFCNEYITSIQTRTTNQFKKKYRGLEILLVDDIQFLSRKEGTQEEFFHTFNALHQKNYQIVMTSDRLPRDIPHLEDRLSSRFGGGMIADIQPPDSETRQAILKSKASQRGWNIENEIIEYIAQNIKTNVRELEGALNRLVAQAMITHQDITPEFAKDTLEGIIDSSKHKNFTPHQIIEAVANFFQLSIKDLLSKSRERRLVRPRQIIMYLLREELHLTLPKIGEILGGKDHTTIMHGIKLIKKLEKNNQEIEKNITLIKEKLYSAE